MAERRAADVPAARDQVAKPDAVRPATENGQEYDGQGNRLHAVRTGTASLEHVQNGLTMVPLNGTEAQTDDHTGRYIAETTFGKPKGRKDETDAVTFHDGDVVEGLSDEELAPLLASGAVRRETKDEVKDSK